jgi:hypothetical protein
LLVGFGTLALKKNKNWKFLVGVGTHHIRVLAGLKKKAANTITTIGSCGKYYHCGL